MNSKQSRSEGVRRIVLTCSVVLVLFPVFWMFGALIGNLGDLSDVEITFCILIGVTGSIVFFLIPRGIAKITYWIIDGIYRRQEQVTRRYHLVYRDLNSQLWFWRVCPNAEYWYVR